MHTPEKVRKGSMDRAAGLHKGQIRSLFPCHFMLMLLVCAMQRITKVKVKFQDLQGRTATMDLDEFPARIFLHEFDHLQASHMLGVFFFGSVLTDDTCLSSSVVPIYVCPC